MPVYAPDIVPVTHSELDFKHSGSTGPLRDTAPRIAGPYATHRPGHIPLFRVSYRAHAMTRHARSRFSFDHFVSRQAGPRAPALTRIARTTRSRPLRSCGSLRPARTRTARTHLSLSPQQPRTMGYGGPRTPSHPALYRGVELLPPFQTPLVVVLRSTQQAGQEFQPTIRPRMVSGPSRPGRTLDKPLMAPGNRAALAVKCVSGSAPSADRTAQQTAHSRRLLRSRQRTN